MLTNGPTSTTPTYASVLDNIETAAVNAAWWDSRATGGDRAAARRAGSDAVEAIDAALRGLYRLREQLVGELARDDTAFLAQSEAYATYRANLAATRH